MFNCNVCGKEAGAGWADLAPGIICADCLLKDPEQKARADEVHYTDMKYVIPEIWQDHLKECKVCQRIEAE